MAQQASEVQGSASRRAHCLFVLSLHPEMKYQVLHDLCEHSALVVVPEAELQVVVEASEVVHVRYDLLPNVHEIVHYYQRPQPVQQMLKHVSRVILYLHELLLSQMQVLTDDPNKSVLAFTKVSIFLAIALPPTKLLSFCFSKNFAFSSAHLGSNN